MGEGVVVRGWRDAGVVVREVVWFRLVACGVASGFAGVGAVLPAGTGPSLRVAVAVLSVVGGVVVVGVVVVAGSVVLAPVRQRDEARARVRELEAPVVDRVLLLRAVYQNGQRSQARVAGMDDEGERCRVACAWAGEAWDILAGCFPGFEEQLDEPPGLSDGSWFSLACSREVKRVGPDRYLERRLLYLRRLLQRFDAPH